MKTFLCAELVISLIIICLFVYQAHRTKHAFAGTVSLIFILGFVIMLSNIPILYARSKVFCALGYVIYFTSADWLLYHLLHFSLEYIGNRFENHVKKGPMLLLLGADSLSIICNLFLGHLYRLEAVTPYRGNGYYEIEMSPLFYIHYGIVLMLVTFCLISLFYKSVTAPIFYRSKYLSIAIIILIIYFLSFYPVAYTKAFSFIAYAAEAGIIYYSTFIYTPQKLLPKTWSLVAYDMSIGLYILDIEGHSLYHNTAAAQLLNRTPPLTDVNGNSLEEWCRAKYLGNQEEFTIEDSFYSEGEEYILNIQLQRIKDTHKQLQGGYFILQDRTEEINRIKREYWLSTHDSLTGLLNRGQFYQKAGQYITSHPDEELLMICTDIKDFKLLNDFLGTQFADTVLVNFAKILQEQMTKALVTGRLVNDVFAALIKKNDYREAVFTREKQQDFFAGLDSQVSFPIVNYIGIYEITERTLPVSVMCDRARLAIATIKGDYNKRVAYYDNSLRDRILHEQELISDLKDAIQNRQLQMYLQPQTTADGSLLGAEALVRWIHPQKGIIQPNDFIPVFEKNGLIPNVDKYIWEEACRQLRKWKDEGLETLYISVNISPKDLYFLNIYDEFTHLVQKYDIDCRNLKLEITESAIAMDFERQLELISKLRSAGFTVEMDDFGSGYSSLNVLKDLPVDILKIDMKFLKAASNETRSRKILQMIIELSAQLDMGVITEGVETAEQVEFLSRMGCKMFQGYHFAKPMSITDFESTYHINT